MSARLELHARQALDAARSLARRYQHDAIDSEHVLIALLTPRAGFAALSIQGVNRPELLARLDACLVARPRSALYRDARHAAEPALSTAVTMALRRASAGRGLAFLRAITAYELLRALLAEPSLAALALAAAIETEELDIVLSQARTMATSRRHQLVTVDHVVSVMLDANWFTTALRVVAADPTEVRASIDARLMEQPLASGRRRARPSRDVDDVARAVRARTALIGRGAVRAQDFILHLLRDSHRGETFVAPALRLPLLRYLATGHADAGDDASESASGDLVEVVFHNDDTTTMEFVVSVLEKCFERPAAAATSIMLDVHNGGEAVVGVFDADDARERVARARLLAVEAVMPLRISWRRVG